MRLFGSTKEEAVESVPHYIPSYVLSNVSQTTDNNPIKRLVFGNAKDISVRMVGMPSGSPSHELQVISTKITADQWFPANGVTFALFMQTQPFYGQ
jgi:hypothetical protein